MEAKPAADRRKNISEISVGRSIFATGVTGFLGKVVLEKSLRTLDGLDTVFVLIRSKDGADAEKRLQKLFTYRCFDIVKRDYPSALKKVVAISGDITLPGLFNNPEDADRIREKVSIVIHGAADVGFGRTLKRSTLINVTGTKHMLEFAKTVPKLELFVHTSTAFVHPTRKERMYEKVYPPPIKPETLMRMVEVIDEKLLDKITPGLISPGPNTYCFTKAVAESLVESYKDCFPIIIGRPSIVGPSAFEPYPGWVDNFNGPNTAALAVAKGILRIVPICPDYRVECVPVDIVANGLIAATWKKLTDGSSRNEITVYNATVGDHVKITQAKINELLKKFLEKYPVRQSLWIPWVYATESMLLFEIGNFFLHVLPAYLLDPFIILWTGKSVLIRAQKRAYTSLKAGFKFFERDWDFDTTNSKILMEELLPEDKAKVNLDPNSITPEEYADVCAQGGIEFMLKEKPGDREIAKRNLERKIWIRNMIYAALLVFLVNWFGNGFLF